MAVVFILPAMTVQGANDSASNTSFQTTSTMPGSGSAYSSTPATLNADGQATYSSQPAATNAPSGPRKIGGYTPTTDPNAPIGDAMLPLMLMAAAFGGGIFLRRRKAARA